MMTNPKPSSLKQPKPPFRWGRAVLFVSLALNLAVAGVVGGTVLGRFGHDRNNLVARDIGFGLFNEALTPQDRKALRGAYVRAVPDIKSERAKMRGDLKAILAALRADPFDVDALETALDTGSARLAARQAQGQVVILDYLQNLSNAQRADLADRLENSLKRRDRGPKPARPSPGGAPPAAPQGD
jgi:uncharacterized membrane protein